MLESELFLLFRIGLSIHKFNKISEGEIGLSLVQWCLLSKLIDLHSDSAFNLAKRVGVHPSTLTQSLKRLHKKGFVHVGDDPRDSRKKIISLTQPGQEALKLAEDRMINWRMQLSDIKDELLRVQEHLLHQIKQKNKSI